MIMDINFFGFKLTYECNHNWKDTHDWPEYIGQTCGKCKIRRSVVVVHSDGWTPQSHVIRNVPKLECQPGETEPPRRPMPSSAWS